MTNKARLKTVEFMSKGVKKRVYSFVFLAAHVRLLHLSRQPPRRPRWNQPPGEPVANVVQLSGVRRIEPYIWGIRGRDPKRPYINVRAESVPKSRAFESRRSLVFVDGFYEWDKKKNPYYIRRRDQAPFALGAVYDESPDRRRFAIITTVPNQTAGRVHHRMPGDPPERRMDSIA